MGRASKLPLGGLFGHVWTIEDERAVSVEAYLDPQLALSAAGLDSAG